jgi:hypothetical protein
MHPSIACKILETTLSDAREAGPDAMRSRAATLISRAHPDMGGDAASAPEHIARIKAARDALVRHLQAGLGDEETPCDLCNGKGKVRGDGWRKHDCPKCNGTGIVKL